MLVEKEVIGLGTHWYVDQKTGVPRKLVVTSDLIQYWHEQGNKMLSLGLTVPIPCEHDFDAHPMTAADKLKNNAGWVKEYRLRDDKLFGVLDVQDKDIADKLPKTIRWTSPWFSSFIDGQGRAWNNVIAHLALTTRPRITDQAPFPNIAAALSLAQEEPLDVVKPSSPDGFVLSQAGLLKKDGDNWLPEYPVAFALYCGGVVLSEHDTTSKDAPPKDAPPNAAPPKGIEHASKFAEYSGDVSMEELIADLLSALGINLEVSSGDSGFKRALYNAVMMKIHELASLKQKQQMQTPPPPAAGQGKTPNKPNPIVQEQQPMYMSLEDINKIPDETMKNIALSMYNENVKLQAGFDKATREIGSLRDAKLAEEQVKRKMRVDRLSRMSPRVKADLDTMLVLPSMALSMGDAGALIDPMGQTLNVLEKGLADMPTLLQTEHSLLSVIPQPTDSEMTSEQSDKLADDFARQMGCPPEKKAG